MPAPKPCEHSLPISKCSECLRAKRRERALLGREARLERQRQKYELNKEAINVSARSRRKRRNYNESQRAYRKTVHGSLVGRIHAATSRGKPWAEGQRDVAAEMLATQHFCEGCGKHVSGSTRHLDHDHVTGLIRGVLCLGCNTSIGQAGESSLRLQTLANYLEKRGSGDSGFDYDLVQPV